MIPAIAVVVAPSVNVDEPRVIVGFAKLAFVIAAEPDKLELVILVADNVNLFAVKAVVIPEPPSKSNISLVA